MRTLAAFILGLFLTSPALADSTIDLLTAGAALTGTEKLPMFQTANPAVTTTPNALKTFVTTSGVVTSITNSDGTLTISPTTGAAVGSLALGHANSWTALQTFTTLTASSTVTLTGISTAAGTTCLALNASNQIVGSGSACGAGGGAVTSVSNADGTLTITPTTGAVVASLALGHANTWSGVQSFTNGDLSLLGATSGNTLLEATAAAGAGTVATFPANTGIVAELNLAQTFSAVQTFSASNGIVYSGAAVGTQVSCLGLDASNNVVKNAAACGSGGGGTPGGATTNVQFNSSGSFGGDAGFTYTTLGQVTIAGGTITTNNKALNITQTWNNNAQLYDAPLFLNVTNTLSAAGSMVADFQVGGTSAFQVRPATLSASTVSWLVGGGQNLTIGPSGGFGILGISLNGPNYYWAFDSNGNSNFYGPAGGGIGWQATGGAFGSFGNFLETALWRDGVVGVVAVINNGSKTTATGFRTYNTTDAAGSAPTNFERINVDFTTTANIATIGTQSGGTGTGRQMILRAAGLYSAAGIALPTCNTTAGGGYPNGTKGAIAVVSDATSPTYNANYTSGGAVVALVVCNGTNWVTQ